MLAMPTAISFQPEADGKTSKQHTGAPEPTSPEAYPMPINSLTVKTLNLDSLFPAFENIGINDVFSTLL